MVTGEEKTYIDGAKHQASTVELMDFKREIETLLVDEGQFLDDEERGHSFLEAIAGGRAKKIIVTCPLFSVPELELERLAKMLGMPVTLHKLERKTKLTVTPEHCPNFAAIKPGSAIVAFSRRRLLELKQLIPTNMKVAVIYGSLPPEVKQEQAR